MNNRGILLRMSGWALALIVGLGGVACDLDEDEAPPRTPDTTRHMVAIGNSLTAGFQSSGLRGDGQVASFANLLSMTITGRELQANLVDAPGIGSTPGLTPLFIDETGNLTADPLTVDPLSLLPNLTYPVPYGNLGIPGATTEEMLNQLDGSNGNPFFDLILRNSALPSGGTVIRQAERLRPEIVTLWSGNNEVLGGATSGSPQNVDPTLPGYVYPADVFEGFYVEMCDRIEALDPEMVVLANVPPVTAIPYTRFWKTFPPTSFGQRWNMDEDCDDLPPEDCSPEGFELDDDPVQFVLLPAGTPISDCTSRTGGFECLMTTCIGNDDVECMSLPGNLTLSMSEVTLIDDAIAAYNVIIEREATERGWAHVDINSAFLAISTTEHDEPINTFFPWNLLNPRQNKTSAFTLDGVHPSEKGHGEVANEFLTAINEHYGTDYPLYDITEIENLAGFERAPAGARTDGPAIVDANARAALDGFVRMLNPRF